MFYKISTTEWRKAFTLFPRRTAVGSWIIGPCYFRRVFCTDILVNRDESVSQYAYYEDIVQAKLVGRDLIPQHIKDKKEQGERLQKQKQITLNALRNVNLNPEK